MEKDVTVYYGTEFRTPWKISIGAGTIIGDQCILDGRNGIEIGRNVNFSTGVWIWTMQHDYNAVDFSLSAKGRVRIGDCGRSRRLERCPALYIGRRSAGQAHRQTKR